jgi:hypothetical protein
LEISKAPQRTPRRSDAAGRLQLARTPLVSAHLYSACWGKSHRRIQLLLPPEIQPHTNHGTTRVR